MFWNLPRREPQPQGWYSKMSKKSLEQPDRDAWLKEGFEAYEQAKQGRAQEQKNLQLLQQAYNEGLQAGGPSEAERRMDEMYRKLNGEADKPAKP